VTLQLNARVKDFFFDRENVRKRLRKKKLNALKKAGALSRKIIRRKPRKRKRKSRPGETPSVHTDSKFATLKNVQFAYDPSSDGVVVGPIKIGSENAEPGAVPAPQALEYGGGSTANPSYRKMKLGKSGPAEVDRQRGDKTINRGRRGGSSEKDVVVWDGQFDVRDRKVVFMKLKTAAQVAKAQKLHDELWGPKYLKSDIAPRPFVAPAMQEAAPDYPELYAKAPTQ